MLKRSLAALLAAVFLACGLSAAADTPAPFPQGFTNLPRSHWMQGRDGLAVPYDLRWYTWTDDFTKYTAADWVITTTEAGTGSATEALGDAGGGTLVITNDNADNDNDFFQTVGEVVTFVAGKKLYFEARYKINEVIQADWVIGLQVRDTSPLAVSDGVFFQSDDGDALLDVHSLASSVDTAGTGIFTAVADTFMTVAFYYDGSSLQVAVNDTLVTTFPSFTPPTTELTVSFGAQQGEATNLKVMTVDYVLVARER